MSVFQHANDVFFQHYQIFRIAGFHFLARCAFKYHQVSHFHQAYILTGGNYFALVGGFLGVLIGGVAFERTGSYDLLFWTLAGIVAALGLGSAIVPTPERARRGALLS